MQTHGPGRIDKVIRNAVYDSRTAEELASWRGYSGSYRFSLAIKPHYHYFRVTDFEGYRLLRPSFDVQRIDRTCAIELAAKHNASDSALKRLGVKLLPLPVSDEPYSLNYSRAVWPKRAPFGWRTLLRQHYGCLWLFKNFELLGLRYESARPMSQREAIAWALRNGAWAE